VNVYIVLVQDRHADPSMMVYSDELIAIAKAKDLAERWARNDNDKVEEACIDRHRRADGLKYYANYSTEGDSVSVWEVAVL
jgi:hypothetical protein